MFWYFNTESLGKGMNHAHKQCSNVCMLLLYIFGFVFHAWFTDIGVPVVKQHYQITFVW
jgi:hypothetical protein